MSKCLNPSCGKPFKPGHYGRRQKVCTRPECRKWYRIYWADTRHPPRGIPAPTWKRIEKEARKFPYNHAFIIVARETGLRKGEILGLAWGDVLDGNGKVKSSTQIRRQWRRGEWALPKTRRSRVAVFSKTARQAFEELLTRSRGGDRLGSLRERRVFPLSPSGVYTWFIYLQRTLDIKNPETGYEYRVHDIRHTLGSNLVRAGRPDLAQVMLGHKNIETTMLYAQKGTEEILEDLEKVKR